MDHYERLGIDRGASGAQVRAAFRALIRVQHPDHGGAAPVGELDALVESWRVLGDPSARRAYDDSLVHNDDRRIAEPRDSLLRQPAHESALTGRLFHRMLVAVVIMVSLFTVVALFVILTAGANAG